METDPSQSRGSLAYVAHAAKYFMIQPIETMR